jgi:hypothetical protein
MFPLRISDCGMNGKRQRGKMTKSENRMTNQTRNPNDEWQGGGNQMCRLRDSFAASEMGILAPMAVN